MSRAQVRKVEPASEPELHPVPVPAKPAAEKLHDHAQYWINQAQAFAVVDQASYETAADFLKRIKALMAEADDAFDPIISKAHAAHAEAIAQKKRVTGPLTNAELVLKHQMSLYATEQMRIRDSEERRLREQAELLAAEARQAELAEAKRQGAMPDELATLADAPMHVSPVLMAPPVPRISGISSREQWKAEVTNMTSLIKFIAAHPEFTQFLQPNMPAINAMARALKSTMNLPGIRVWSETGIAAAKR